MPQMSPLLWETFIFLNLIGLMLMMAYLNFLTFFKKNNNMKIASSKLNSIIYKW